MGIEYKGDEMLGLDNMRRALGRPKYLLAFLAAAAIMEWVTLLSWLYRGLSIYPRFDAVVEWAFVVSFPVLFGLVVAVQWYNLAERKSCPLSASGGGALGWVAGIVSWVCPTCPSALQPLLGLGGGVVGGIIGGPWVKLGSLVLLAWALHRASSVIAS